MEKKKRQEQEAATTLAKRLSKFLNTTSGLDLTLRLIHGCAIVLVQVLHNETHAATFLAAARQLALGACVWLNSSHSPRHA